MYTFHISLAVTVVEVERLWKRFEQLGANKHGIVTARALKDVPITSDIFAKNVSSFTLYFCTDVVSRNNEVQNNIWCIILLRPGICHIF